MASIRKRGIGQYQARLRIKGYPVATQTFKTRKEALQWATEREQLLLQGLGDAQSLAEKMSLADALDRYGREVTPSKKSHVQEANRIRCWKANPLASLSLTEIRGSHLAAYRDLRTQRGISGNTLRLEFALLSHLYEVARKDWGLETLSNPVKVIRKPKVARGRDRRLLPGEEALLLKYCDETGSTRLKNLIILAVDTAMRRGELVSLKWKDVNLRSRMVYLHDTKNGESRVVPLSSRATSVLSSIENKSPHDQVFAIHKDVVTWDFGQACKACGIIGLTFHDLRHEATSRLFEKGFNMMEVSTITGHKSLEMLKRYTHLRPSSLLDRLG
jgi:integrase